MTEENLTSAPQSAPDENPDAAVIRRNAAAQLGQQLSLSTALIEDCHALVQSPRNKRGEAMRNAAHLMQASANLARALTLTTLGETRHRTITEKVVPPEPPPSALEEHLDEIALTLARMVRADAAELEKGGTGKQESPEDHAEKRRAAIADLMRSVRRVSEDEGDAPPQAES
jgi:hypothetical protein